MDNFDIYELLTSKLYLSKTEVRKILKCRFEVASSLVDEINEHLKAKKYFIPNKNKVQTTEFVKWMHIDLVYLKAGVERKKANEVEKRKK